MTNTAGYLKGGLPYNRLGDGPQYLIVFQGLVPENNPLSGITARMLLRPFKPLAEHYTVLVVGRRPGLPTGYSLQDMANDYASMVSDEFGGEPVELIGLSTGGSIAQVFAADYPELVKRMVLYSTAYKLGEECRQFQLRTAELARKGRWGAASAEGFAFMFLPRKGLAKRITRPITWPVQLLAMVARPASVSDYMITIEAEDAFDFRTRLGEIKAPSIVVGGAKDPFYSPDLFRETAEGIPSGELVLYDKAGHSPTGRRVAYAILAFLRQDAREASGFRDRG
jgi:pimeloyl-ACP methyl ester carboxylesterase